MRPLVPTIRSFTIWLGARSHFAPGDPQLILLLARAQSLSGRPLDALVLLARLEVAGIPTDAARNKDFERVRGCRSGVI